MKTKIIKWFKDAFAESGGKKAVIGISGGKDSSIVAALACESIGAENVLGVLMPNGIQSDIDFSYNLCKHLGIEYVEIDISAAVNPLYDKISNAFGKDFISTVTTTNTPPRIRMATLYAIAGSINGGRVINTSNRSEAYIGYSTKWGDSCGDIFPLLNLTVGQVIALGEELGLSNEFIKKPPADGLTGKTDEDNIGFSYQILDQYLLTGKISDREIKQKIDKMHEIAGHKLNLFGLTFKP